MSVGKRRNSVSSSFHKIQDKVSELVRGMTDTTGSVKTASKSTSITLSNKEIEEAWTPREFSDAVSKTACDFINGLSGLRIHPYNILVDDSVFNRTHLESYYPVILYCIDINAFIVVIPHDDYKAFEENCKQYIIGAHWNAGIYYKNTDFLFYSNWTPRTIGDMLSFFDGLPLADGLTLDYQPALDSLKYEFCQELAKLLKQKYGLRVVNLDRLQSYRAETRNDNSLYTCYIMPDLHGEFGSVYISISHYLCIMLQNHEFEININEILEKMQFVCTAINNGVTSISKKDENPFTFWKNSSAVTFSHWKQNEIDNQGFPSDKTLHAEQKYFFGMDTLQFLTKGK